MTIVKCHMCCKDFKRERDLIVYCRSCRNLMVKYFIPGTDRKAFSIGYKLGVDSVKK